MGNSIVKALRLLPLVALIAAACGPPVNIKAPAGFAEYRASRGAFRAISASGVRIRARAVKNDPVGDVAMWQTAVDRYFTDEGYHLLGREPLDKGGRKGSISEYRCRHFGVDYIYSLVLIPAGKKVILVEISGREDRYARERVRIRESIASMEVKL